MFRPLIPLALALTLAGCGTTATPASLAARPGALTVAGGTANAEALQAGTRALDAFARKPDGGRKVPQLRALEEPAPGPQLPDSILKMRQLSATALTEAGSASDYKARWGVTDSALDQIATIKLAGFGKRNVPVLLGRLAARGYGYIGAHPTYETRYLSQVPVLEFLRASADEATLTAGSPLFALGAAMIDAATTWDQGLRVGITVLTVLEENTAERDVRKACKALLEKAVKQPTKELACRTMVDGLMELARRQN